MIGLWFNVDLTEEGKRFFCITQEVPIHIEITQENYGKLRELIEDGLQFDAPHHKQWCLQEIAKVLGIDVDLDELGVEEGIAP